MKAHEQAWKVCDVDYRIVEDARTELVIADLRVPPHEGCDEAARLISAAPDMARALLATGSVSNGEWHDGACAYFATGRCYSACDTSRAALKKAGVL